MKISFRGDPFVDAGIAGMCAAAEVESAAQLDAPVIERAVETLIKFMLSEAAFKPRQIEGKPKPTAFATSEMTVIFTKNGVLSQSSFTAPKRKQVYTSRLYAKRDAVMQILRGEATPSAKRCFIDGQPACFDVGNDEFPLVDSRSKRNFHPSLGEGHPVGALTALALEFFPLAVLRTGVNSGFFWFVHTAHEPIAVACAKLTVDRMNDAIAKNDGFGFFGDWGIGNRGTDTALVALIRDLVSGRAQRNLTWEEMDKSGFPITAYIFSNDSRSPTIESHDLPDALFDFFIVLKARGETMRRFNYEILANERKGAFVIPRTMLKGEPIIRLCLIKPIKEFPGALRGSWEAHAIYAKEVLEMSGHFIRDVERIAGRVVESEDGKDLLFSLQSMGGRAALMRLTRKGAMDGDEFARLVSDKPYAANTARDYLLGAIYEMNRARANNQEFAAWHGDEEAAPPLPEAVQLAQNIGAVIAEDDRATRLTADIARAGKVNALRGVMVKATARGLVDWAQFVSMFPPEKPFHALLVRDYLLAYLYSALRDKLEELPEPELPDAREMAAVEAEINAG